MTLPFFFRKVKINLHNNQYQPQERSCNNRVEHKERVSDGIFTNIIYSKV